MLKTSNTPDKPSVDYGDALTKAGIRINQERAESQKHPNPEAAPYARGLQRALDIVQEEYEQAGRAKGQR